MCEAERHEERTLRKGLPRFVVFIIWEEVAWAGAASLSAGEGIASCRGDERRKKGKKRLRKGEENGGRRWKRSEKEEVEGVDCGK